MKNKEKNNIEFVVLNYFIRVLKSEGKYMLFRCGVNNGGLMGMFLKLKKQYSSDSPFISCSSTLEVAKTLEKITNDMAKSNGKKGGIKDLDRYEHVTMTINHLLHFFVEINGVSMDKLCSMGEQIYNLSCNRLFGDTLEDLEQHEIKEVKNITDPGQLKAKLFQDYIRGVENGKISHSTSFDDYLNSHKDEFESMAKKSKKPVENMGQMLGRQPDDENFFIREVGRPSWLDDVL